MRLTENERLLIKSIISKIFEPDASIWLFGSRLDDSKRGGDVDLYVESSVADTYTARLRALQDLESALPYPIDLVVREHGRDLPIYRIAHIHGIRL
ncbi:MAG: nucleotidyltransferase domain-containing protein [Gallionella sp.]